MSAPDKPASKEVKPVKPEAAADTPAAAPAATAAKSGSNKTVFIVVGVVAAVVLIPIILLTIGASIIGHKITNGVKVTSSGDGKSATIKTANGDEISTGGASKTLPKDFPSSVSVYNGTIVTSARLTIDGKVTWSVVIETKDDVAKVGDALSQSFSTNGWTADLDNKTSDGGLIAANNTSAALHVQVLWTVKSGKTSISYTVVPTPAQ